MQAEPFFLKMFKYYPNHFKFDPYKYRSVLRSRFVNDSGLKGLIDSHHIIPQQLKKHELISKLDFDVHRSYNLVYLRNTDFKATRVLQQDVDITMSYVHEGGHRRYNDYVREQLNIIEKIEDTEAMRYEFWLFVKHLEKGIGERSVPWN